MINSPALVLSFDLRGTNVKVQLFEHSNTATIALSDLIIRPSRSHASASEILETIVSAGHQALDNAGLTDFALSWIAVAMCGPYDPDRGCFLIKSGKYQALYGIDLASVLAQHFGAPALFVGDVVAMAIGVLASHDFSTNYRSRVLVVSLGTNLAYTRAENGEVLVNDYAALAHWDRTARVVAEPVEGVTLTDTARWFTARFGAPAVEVATAARRGDHYAQRAFDIFGAYAGLALAKFTEHYPADHVVITGGMAEAFELFEFSLNAVLAPGFAHVLANRQPSTLGAVLGTARRVLV
jgi:predicted NBD/HSP70 family sugar kinase